MHGISRSAVLAVGFFVCATSMAATENVLSPIKSIIASGDVFGGCMVFLSDWDAPDINCKARWVSLSCTGELNDRAAASRMMESAQMAYALDQRLNVYVTDTQKHNGYCVAKRVDITKF